MTAQGWGWLSRGSALAHRSQPAPRGPLWLRLAFLDCPSLGCPPSLRPLLLAHLSSVEPVLTSSPQQKRVYHAFLGPSTVPGMSAGQSVQPPALFSRTLVGHCAMHFPHMVSFQFSQPSYEGGAAVVPLGGRGD